MGCGYVWTNTVNGKQYVGKSVEPEVRRQAHVADARAGRGFYFHNAIRKYGVEAFTYEVVFESDNPAELKAWEIAEIARRGTMNPNVGYNQTKGGEGCVLTPEAEARRIASLIAAFARPEVKAKRAATRALPDVKARRSEASKAANARPDVRAKRAAASKAANARPEVKAKRSASSKINNARPEVKAKISASIRATFARPEVKARHAASLKAYNARPETKMKQSASSTARNNARLPNVFCDGRTFVSMEEAGRRLGVSRGTPLFRGKSANPRFRWWHTIPNHNDPECDAVEECFAIATWAAANPDHANVPEWARAFRFAEHFGKSTPGRHGAAPEWAKRAAA